MITACNQPHEAWRTARAEAAAWITRLHGPDRAPSVEAAFREWLAASPDNAREFENVTEVWDAAKWVPMGGMPRQGPWPRSRSPRYWSWAAAVVVACGMTALSVYAGWFSDRYSTGVGEQRSLRLSDGTRVIMNSDSEMEVDYDSSHRAIRLKRGEAFFEVAQNIARPFVVLAGARQVTALATSFSVRYGERGTAVTLVEGKVAVSSEFVPEHNFGGHPAATVLAAGERLQVSSAESRIKVDRPVIDAVTAWRRGEVVLDKTPLAEAIEEMNRYSATKLVASSAAIGHLPVSGMYHTGDSEEFARTVALLYKLEAIKKNNEIRLTGIPAP